MFVFTLPCAGEGWFRFDSAKVGFCRGRGAVAETLHGEEPKVGARALQGLGRRAKGRGGAERNAVAFDRNGATRRREGAQKRPDREGRVGPEGAWARRSLDFAQEFGGVGIALGSGLREVAAREGAVAEELVRQA